MCNEIVIVMPWRLRLHEVFHRMQLFVNTIVENSLGQSDSSDADSTGNADRFLNLKYHPPRVLVVGHNAVKIDLPMLVS